LLPLLALLVVAETRPVEADLLFLQAHNLFAIALWLAWRRRRGHLYLAVLAAFALASAWIWLAPLPEPLLLRESHWTGLNLWRLGDTLSRASDSLFVARSVLFFAFAQSVHYLIWVRLIPDEARPTKDEHVSSAVDVAR
jgi:hypothetical protein